MPHSTLTIYVDFCEWRETISERANYTRNSSTPPALGQRRPRYDRNVDKLLIVLSLGTQWVDIKGAEGSSHLPTQNGRPTLLT